MSWIPNISNIDGPRYLALAGAIASAIDGGDLLPGAQLPPQRDLARELGVTVGTVGRAYALAKSRRLVTGEVGRGTFVRGAASDDTGGNVMPKPPERNTVDLVCYRSPVTGLREMLVKALDYSGEASKLHVNSYAPNSGFLSHRIAGAAWIARAGFVVPPEQVILVNGAQQGISVALAGLCARGETVLAESLTYSGLRAIAGLLGLQLHGVAIDDKGMLPEELEAACDRVVDARVIYLQPTLHNPTTATMPLQRRQQIAEIIRRRGLTLIEDGAGASVLNGDRPPALSSLVPERCCYITSVSKSISPSLRLGYIGCAAHLHERIASTFQAMSLAVSPLVAEMVTGMIDGGMAERIARQTLTELGRRQDVAKGVFAGYPVRSDRAASFIWISLPAGWESNEFVVEAQRRGISVVSADHFVVNRASRPQAIRVRLCPNVGLDVLKGALEATVAIMCSNPPLNATVI